MKHKIKVYLGSSYAIYTVEAETPGKAKVEIYEKLTKAGWRIDFNKMEVVYD